MKPLLEFSNRDSATTGTVGAVSGILSWFIAHSPEIASVAGAIGALATMLIAVAALLRLLYNASLGLFHTIQRWRRNREQRRLHQVNEILDDLLP